MSLKQYIVYFIVGSFVGITTVMTRELIALMIGDTPLFYFISVLIVYFLGIILSYVMHKKITYRIVGHASNQKAWGSIPRLKAKAC